jgi:hypothetical protein
MITARALAAAAALLLTLSARAETTPDAALATASVPPLTSSAAPGPDHGKAATDDATPAGAGVLEVEAAYGPSLTHEGGSGFDHAAHAHSHTFTMGVLYGLTDHLDVKVGSGFGYTVDQSDPTGPTRGSGRSDLNLGSRWRFLALTDRALDVMLTTTVVAPTGLRATDTSVGLTQGFWSVRNGLVASKDWGRETANVEVALTLPVGGGAGALRWAACGNVALGYAFVPWFQPFVEANYDQLRDADTHQRLALTAGINMSAQSGARLLVGVQQAVWGRGVPETTAGLVAIKGGF